MGERPTSADDARSGSSEHQTCDSACHGQDRGWIHETGRRGEIGIWIGPGATGPRDIRPLVDGLGGLSGLRGGRGGYRYGLRPPGR